MDLVAAGLLITLMVGFYLPVPLTYLVGDIPFNIYFLPITFFLLSLWIGRYAYISALLRGIALALSLLILHSDNFYKNDFIQGQNNKYLVTGEIVNDQFPLTCEQALICQHTLLIKPSLINNTEFSSRFFSPLLLIKADKHKIDLAKGMQIQFSAKLNRPLGYENQFGFNLAKWSFANHILARGKAVDEILVLDKGITLSQHFLNKLVLHLSNYEYSAYLYPLLVAELSLLNREQKTQLQHYGLSHLFAISGLHIGILFLFITQLVSLMLFWWRKSNKFLFSYVTAAIGVWGYVWLIDFPTPSLRAAILLSLWLLLKHQDWHMKKVWLFAVMTIATLVIQPTGVLDAGWWLSISAVAGIFIFNHLFRHSEESGLLSKIKSAMQFQLFIGIWLLPASLYWFSGVSIAGFWINIILVPVFCFAVIPGLFLATSLLCIGLTSASSWLFYILNGLLSSCLELSEILSLKVSWLSLPSYLYAFFIAVFLSFWLFKTVNKSVLWRGLAVALVSLCGFSFIPEGENLELHVFDVGQGTSALFYRNGSGVLYDLGPVYASGFSATAAVVKPNILGLGIAQLDKLFISHQDSDHYGDINAIVQFLRPNETGRCSTQAMLWQNIKLVRIWPASELESKLIFNDNDLSCVLKIIDLKTNLSFLLTGDISRDVELRLVEKHHKAQINLQADVLFSAHHGSRFSSSYPFLKTVMPKFVVHTAGVFNHFGFPTEQVRRRVEQLSTKQYSTSNWGQLVFNIDTKTNQLNVRTWLNWLSPYWKKQNPFSFQVEIR